LAKEIALLMKEIAKPLPIRHTGRPVALGEQALNIPDKKDFSD